MQYALGSCNLKIKKEAGYVIYNVVLNIPNTTLMVSFIKGFPDLLMDYFYHLETGAKPVSFVLQAIDAAQYLLSLVNTGAMND